MLLPSLLEESFVKFQIKAVSLYINMYVSVYIYVSLHTHVCAPICEWTCVYMTLLEISVSFSPYNSVSHFSRTSLTKSPS